MIKIEDLLSAVLITLGASMAGHYYGRLGWFVGILFLMLGLDWRHGDDESN